NTEETLKAFRAVSNSEATGIAVTTGGELAEEAAAAGMPLVRYAWPGPPRTGLGYGVFVPLAILRRLDVLPITDHDIEAAFAQTGRATAAWGPHAPDTGAQQRARWLHGGLPAIIGPDVLEVAARRWADDFAENAKQMAAAYSLPQFNHNQLEAAAGASGDT